MNSLKIINEEIEKLKTILELDDILRELSDNDYKFYNDKLQTLRQTKEELEAWEVVKPAISIEHLEDCQIRIMYGENHFMNVSKEKATKVKKTLVVKDDK